MPQTTLVHFSLKCNYESILQNGLQTPSLRPTDEMFEKYRQRMHERGFPCETQEDLYAFLDHIWTPDSRGGRFVISATRDLPDIVNSQLEEMKTECYAWVIDYFNILHLVKRIFVNIFAVPIQIQPSDLFSFLDYAIQSVGSFTQEPHRLAFEHLPHVFIQLKEETPFIPPEFLSCQRFN